MEPFSTAGITRWKHGPRKMRLLEPRRKNAVPGNVFPPLRAFHPWPFPCPSLPPQRENIQRIHCFSMIENMPLEGDSHKKERGFSTGKSFYKGGQGTIRRHGIACVSIKRVARLYRFIKRNGKRWFFFSIYYKTKRIIFLLRRSLPERGQTGKRIPTSIQAGYLIMEKIRIAHRGRG